MEDFTGKGGKPAAEPDRVNVYLLSGGKYHQRWTEDEGGKLLLSAAFHSANNCLLFDWDVTLETAKVLRELLPLEYSKSLTFKQNAEILDALRKEFPEADVRPEAYYPVITKGEMVTIPGHSFVEFRGIGYEFYRNCIYNYTIRIGPSVCSITGDVMVQGPKRVDRSEFEDEADSVLPNAPPPLDIDAKAAKPKRAEYAKMLRFQNLVTKAIGSSAK